MRNRSQNNRIVVRLGDTVLSLLAIAGGISIVLVILAITLNVSIMMFRTGSMEPTISTGSIALVREIPATDMAEGDIITVDRGEELLPVTHRVTEIRHVDTDSGAVTFAMRGDANDTDDPEPYTASSVQRTMFAIPGVAPVIQSLQNPLVLGGLTLGATGLVIWAFWPRNETPVQRPHGAHASHSLVLPMFLVLMSPVLLQQHLVPDEANVTREKITGEYIRLESTGDRKAMANMVPGQPVTWAVDVWVDAPEPGLVDLELSAVGPLAAQPDVLSTEVIVCTPHPASVTECHSEAQLERKVVDTSELVDDRAEQFLGSMRSKETRRVLITATLADSPPASMQSATASFRFTAAGYDERLSATPNPVVHEAQSDDPDGLANTGPSIPWLAAVAALFVVLGAVLLNRGDSHTSSEVGDVHG